MKKDFSQPFKARKVLHCELLIRHTVTGKFLLWRSTEPMEDDWHRTLTVEIEDGKGFSQALAKYLYSEHLLLNSYRELTRQTNIAFSFLNKVPGSETSEACFLVDVDTPMDVHLDKEEEKAVFIDLFDIVPSLSNGPYPLTLLARAVAQLEIEAILEKVAPTEWDA